MITKNKTINQNGNLVLYTGPKGAVELRADTDKETIWATQAQIASLFDVNSQAITKHLINIYKENELEQKATCSKMEQVKIEGNRSIKRFLEFYNLDAIIAVGYRVNSKKATQFRIWATKTLREYLIKGFNLDSKKLQKETEKFEDLRDAIVFIESKAHGKVKGKLTLKLTKEII